MSDTRTLWAVSSHRGKAVLKQQAIPWCTAHGSKGTKDGPDCDLKLFAEDFGIPCVISTGGPDHKWWVDVE